MNRVMKTLCAALLLILGFASPVAAQWTEVHDEFSFAQWKTAAYQGTDSLPGETIVARSKLSGLHYETRIYLLLRASGPFKGFTGLSLATGKALDDRICTIDVTRNIEAGLGNIEYCSPYDMYRNTTITYKCFTGNDVSKLHPSKCDDQSLSYVQVKIKYTSEMDWIVPRKLEDRWKSNNDRRREYKFSDAGHVNQSIAREIRLWTAYGGGTLHGSRPPYIVIPFDDTFRQVIGRYRVDEK